MAGTREGALDRARHIRDALTTIDRQAERIAKHIATARRLNDHELLGYETWADYMEKEFGDQLRLMRSELRQAITPVLREGGLNTQQVAAVCGVDRKTVQRDERKGKPPKPPATNVAPPEPSRLTEQEQASLLAKLQGGEPPTFPRVGARVVEGPLTEDGTEPEVSWVRNAKLTTMAVFTVTIIRRSEVRPGWTAEHEAKSMLTHIRAELDSPWNRGVNELEVELTDFGDVTAEETYVEGGA